LHTLGHSAGKYLLAPPGASRQQVGALDSLQKWAKLAKTNLSYRIRTIRVKNEKGANEKIKYASKVKWLIDQKCLEKLSKTHQCG
jgi:hypothetical protein